MEKEIECVRQDLALKGYSESTRKAYLKGLLGLHERFRRPAAELTREELRVYVEELQGRGKGAAWLGHEFGALLFLYRKTFGRPDLVSFISLPRRHSPLPAVLSVKEVHTLLDAIRNRRYQAIAMVMYGAGLRIAEAIALEVRDIDGERGVIRVRHGKGDKAREAKLSPSLYQWLREYWRLEQPRGPHLFANRAGQLPRFGTIRKALAKAASDAWIKKRVTPHVLRNALARCYTFQETAYLKSNWGWLAS